MVGGGGGGRREENVANGYGVDAAGRGGFADGGFPGAGGGGGVDVGDAFEGEPFRFGDGEVLDGGDGGFLGGGRHGEGAAGGGGGGGGGGGCWGDEAGEVLEAPSSGRGPEGGIEGHSKRGGLGDEV